MPKTKQNAEIDMKNVDPDLLKLAQQLAKQMNSGKESKRTKNDKSICPAAVKVQTKGRVNDKIEKGETVYRLKNDNKDEYFSSCTRTILEGKKLCFKHNEAQSKNPDNLYMFDDISGNNDSYKMGKKDLLEVRKTSNKKESTQKNPNPIITVSLTKALRDQMESFVDADTDNKDHDDDPTDDHDESQEESDNEEASVHEEETPEQEDASEESEQEEDSDDEASTIEFSTKDGRTLYLDQSNETVYELDDESEGVEIGKLMTVNDSSAPIYLESMKSDCIVGTELVDNGKEYIRCTVSNKLYQQKAKNLVLVGHVNVAKNKSLKVVLDKKGK